jgi:hypothetical protein
MATYYSELYVNLLTKALLEPGEEIVAKSRANYAPWYSKLLFWLKRDELLVATNRRLIVLIHRARFLRPFGLTEVESHVWTQQSEVAAKGLFGWNLLIKNQAGKRVFDLRPSNVEKPTKTFSKSALAAWQNGRGLPAQASS